MKKFAKKTALFLLALLIALEGVQLATDSTAVTSSVANMIFKNNLHEVVPQTLFRSAQMSGPEMERTVQEHGIKTVVDLRLRPKLDAPGARSEQEVVSSLGATYVHFPMSSARVPEERQVQELLKMLPNLKTPVLVHCSSGTHRSGFFAAVWMMLREGASLERAKEQLGLKYGFVGAERQVKQWFQGHETLDDVIWRYEEAYKQSGVPLLAWLQSGAYLKSPDSAPLHEGTQHGGAPHGEAPHGEASQAALAGK
jgi:protein tyrosine phosphatase (PTP) superfamily phosphohydrolase (DUF442 family)